MIYPAVQKIETNGTFILKDEITVAPEGNFSSLISLWCEENGFSSAENGKVKISARLKNNEKMTYLEKARRITDEKYIIESSELFGMVEIKITASAERAVWHALNTIGKMLAERKVEIGKIEDYPLFKSRGYIEGFYGKPWSHEERIDMLRLMGKNHMNTYYYAPKDDPYHRELWSKLYPAEELKKLGEIVDYANKIFVDMYFCIAPGLSMKYSSESDFEALVSKMKQLYNIGIKNFGLLLDDIPSGLYHEEDKERFGGETVNAHIYLANRLFCRLKEKDRSLRLTLCPLQYHGKGDEYFISKLGRNIDPQIDLFWTGRNICSQELTMPEACNFINSTLHRPLYWDNFPVNDAEMYNEMHLGFIEGRDEELYRFSEGIISNCMEFCECSKIPMLTIADFLWNPEKYNSRKSWKRALAEIVGEGSEDFIYFADNLLTSCLKVENSPLLNETLSLAEALLRNGDFAGAGEAVSQHAARLKRACEMIEKQDRKLFCELKKWLPKQQKLCKGLETGAEFLKTQNFELQNELSEILQSYLAMPETLADFSFQAAMEMLIKIPAE